MPDSRDRSDSPKVLSRILLIDDDAISREVLAMMLEMHGVAIDTAEDGAAAISLLDGALGERLETRVDGLDLPLVILMDTQMPGLSGVALIEALRKRCRGRIVAISGSPVSDEILQATDGFLMKPIEVEALVALLEGGSEADARSVAGKIALEAAEKNSPDRDNEQVGVLAPAILDPVILDPVILGKFRAMMPPAAVREIYAATADDLRPRLATLKAAMDAGDGAEVRRVAHAIKGCCAMVGLDQATAAAVRLETGDSTSNAAGTYAAELEHLYAALAALEGILGSDF